MKWVLLLVWIAMNVWAAEKNDSNVVVRLQTRNNSIVVKSGQNGNSYTVLDKGGKEALKDVNAAEFQAKLPDVYDQYKKSVANLNAGMAN